VVLPDDGVGASDLQAPASPRIAAAQFACFIDRQIVAGPAASVVVQSAAVAVPAFGAA
jgi:hypothetical protein